ncbi:transcriptional regulator [Methanofollis aquaemaris]|uniref:Transcriptional regulator n=2 Tax=Methanofollis aquaemaris TaxID=126734 RepID=A0A8A3S9X8_9EURY|nr:transcriptional regulator [Methanofollis aquaemaris]
MTEKPMVELLTVAGRTNRTRFRDQVLRPLLDAGLVEMTIPEKPGSGKQRCRATEKGHVLIGEDRS